MRKLLQSGTSVVWLAASAACFTVSSCGAAHLALLLELGERLLPALTLARRPAVFIAIFTSSKGGVNAGRRRRQGPRVAVAKV